ncbi:hypothetical protein AB7M16_001273 [Bradyrhizobium sp. USDA 372]
MTSDKKAAPLISGAAVFSAKKARAFIPSNLQFLLFASILK